MLSFAAHCKLDKLDDKHPSEHHIITLCISTPSGKHRSLRATSLPSGANQTNNKSIYNSNHIDFLPSAIISMVYLLTELFLKAEASRGLFSGVAADVTVLEQPASLLYLHGSLFGSY